MKKYLGTTLGNFYAGLYVMTVWTYFVVLLDEWGGWLAAILLISILWYMNHYLGMIKNEGAFIDMALAIGLTGTLRDTFLLGTDALVSSIPTLLLVCIGGAAGGIVAVIVEREMAKEEVSQIGGK